MGSSEQEIWSLVGLVCSNNNFRPPNQHVHSAHQGKIVSAYQKEQVDKKNALNHDVMIVDRKIEYNPYAEYRDEEYECELTLQIPAFQTTIDSDKQIVRAFVSKQIYDQYIRRDIAKVFFYATNSLVIHIEGE